MRICRKANLTRLVRRANILTCRAYWSVLGSKLHRSAIRAGDAKHASPALFSYPAMNAVTKAPLVYSLRDGEGVFVGEQSLVVKALGDGQAEIEVGCTTATVYAGERISLGVGKLLVQQFSDDGKRRLVLRVDAPREVAHGVLSRGEVLARATG